MQRRSSLRCPVQSAITLETFDSEKGFHTKNSGTITDISIGGIGLSLPTCLKNNTEVNIWADLCPTKPVITGKAQVRWSKHDPEKETFLHGLEFTDHDANILRDTLREINIKNAENFLATSLPKHIKQSCQDAWIYKNLDLDGITSAIEFSPPFLKLQELIIFSTYESSACIHNKSVATGILTRDDTRGHYNDTIFLALCARIMGQITSAHLAVLHPSSAPQVVEANHTEPLLSETDFLWQPRKDGSRFFAEATILKKRLNLAVAEVRVSFGNIIIGSIKELKIVLTPRDLIHTAKELPEWK